MSHHWFRALCMGLCLASTQVTAEPWTLSTVAGNGQAGNTGDGGPARAASLKYPSAVAVSQSGLLIVADTYNHRLRQIDALGNIAPLAGTGTRGFSGDGGSALAAELAYPSGIAIDAYGRVYIADTYNLRIRRINADGSIETIAGSGQQGYAGDGGPALQARFNLPTSLAFDSQGRLYIADSQNYVVRRLELDGSISTVAGGGSVGMDLDNRPATSVQLGMPLSLAIDANDRLYLSNSHYLVRYLDENNYIFTLAGNRNSGFSPDGTLAREAALGSSYGLATDSAGQVYFTEQENHRLRGIDDTQRLVTLAGSTQGRSGDGGPATQAQFNQPRGLAIAPDGAIYIADYFNHQIRKFAPNQAPHAAFSWQATEQENGFMLDMDASASSDPENGPLNYLWTIPALAHQQTGMQTQLSIADTGVYDVQLVVTDALGSTDTLLQSVTLAENLPPVANFSLAPTSGPAPLQVQVDASASYDPEGKALAYTWLVDDVAQPSTTAMSSLLIELPGTHSITLSVADDRGLSSSSTADVNVLNGEPNGDNHAPLAAFNAWIVNTASGQRLYLDASPSSDPDGDALTYSWWLNHGLRGEGQKVSFDIHSNGRYSIRLTVTDSHGASSYQWQSVRAGTKHCQGYASFGFDEGLLYLPSIRVEGEQGENLGLFRAVLQLQGERFALVSAVPIHSTEADGECTAHYRWNQHLAVPAVDIPLSETDIHGFGGVLRQLPEEGEMVFGLESLNER